ncbi:C40 family peptidase [Bacillus sp. JJ1764]|uniref:C40 family peptidase n=1 Tax=Bacillus sp. JJ1764 TaxID=3122964 RepID=UPI002FFE3808
MKKKIVSTLSTTALLSTLFSGTVLADTYKVQSGDTLSEIASNYHTSVTELKKLNNLNTNLIYVNQVLQVSTTTPMATKTSTAPVAKTTVQTYKVVKGDALIKIANRFNVTVGELQQWNNIKGTVIYVGQVLKVSPAAQTVTKPKPQTPAPKPTTGTSVNTTIYTVKAGDCLSKIAIQFGMSIQELKSLNGLKSDLIYVGQKLKVTVKTASGGSTTTVTTSPSKPTVTTGSSVTDAQVATKMITIAKSLMGVPYVWGGSTVSGFDCSGFIYYVANQAGKVIGRYSAAGYYDRSYYVNNPKPGDLVFFENTYKPGISHIGIFLGNNQFIHANDGTGVTISNLSSPYYAQHFSAYKRLY